MWFFWLKNFICYFYMLQQTENFQQAFTLPCWLRSLNNPYSNLLLSWISHSGTPLTFAGPGARYKQKPTCCMSIDMKIINQGKLLGKIYFIFLPWQIYFNNDSKAKLWFGTHRFLGDARGALMAWGRAALCPWLCSRWSGASHALVWTLSPHIPP